MEGLLSTGLRCFVFERLGSDINQLFTLYDLHPNFTN